MFTALLEAFRTPDLRNKILFTLGMLAVYRVGHHITVPGVNLAALDELAIKRQAGQMCADYSELRGVRVGGERLRRRQRRI